MREFLGTIVDILGWIRARFEDIADLIEWIDLFISPLAIPFRATADFIADVQIGIWGFADRLWEFEQATGEKVDWWDIEFYVLAAFPFLGKIGETIVETVKWLWPDITNPDNWLRRLLYLILPWGDDPDLGIKEEFEYWIETTLKPGIYRILPWGDAPDLSMAEEAKQWLLGIIPEFPDIEIPGFDWLVEKIGDALGEFLKIASWPFWRNFLTTSGGRRRSNMEIIFFIIAAFALVMYIYERDKRK